MTVRNYTHSRMATQRALAVVAFLSGITAGLSLISTALKNQHPTLCAVGCVIVLVTVVVALRLLFPRRRRAAKPVELDFRGKAQIYGYQSQRQDFDDVINVAVNDRDSDGNPPVLVVLGASGVGKTSLLLNFKDAKTHPPNAVRMIDLRNDANKVAGELEHLLGNMPLDMLASNLPQWIQSRVDDGEVIDTLANTILILDQFEQSGVSEETRRFARCLVDDLGSKCALTVVSVRAEILNQTITSLHHILSSLDVYNRVRVFELLPTAHSDPRAWELVAGIWQSIAHSDMDREFAKEVTVALHNEVGDRALLPVVIRLVCYALVKEKVLTRAAFHRKGKGNIERLVDALFDASLESAPDKLPALRILFGLVNTKGVAEQFQTDHIREICGLRYLGDGTVEKYLERLRKTGLLVKYGNRYAISHEHLSEIAGRRPEPLLTADEREQILARQRYIKTRIDDQRGHLPLKPRDLLDAVERVRLKSLEGLVGTASLLVCVIRICVWTPPNEFLHFDEAFLPAAVAFPGATFFWWLLYGNVGKALREYQGWRGKAMWYCVAVCPLLGCMISAVWAEWWLLAGG